jgi:hypothetical protein
VNPSWYNGPTPPSGQSVASSGLTISPDSLIDFRNSTLTNVSSILATNGLWSLSSDGTLVAQRVEAREIKAERYDVTLTDGVAASGEGVFPQGNIAVVVMNPLVKPKSRVFVSFLQDPGSTHWIEARADGTFTVRLARPAVAEIPFEYWIVGIDDRRTPEAPSQPPTEPPPAEEPPPTESGSGTPETTPGGEQPPTEPPPAEEPPPTESGSGAPATLPEA